MEECYRVLKPGRWVSLCYHDTSEGTWQLLQDLMAEVGFISEQSDQALYIDTGQKSFNQLMADKVTKRDLVINFRKPRPDELLGQLALDFEAATFEENARAVLRDALDAHPGSPADRLYDDLVSRMVRKGAFERHNFDALLRTVAEETPPGSGHWYLAETAEQADDAERIKEDKAAAYLEIFMGEKVKREKGEGEEGEKEQREKGEKWEEDLDLLTSSPFTLAEGIHYSDLFERYLPVADKPRRMLAEWLPEYFFKTEAGTWRPPANEKERAQKAALRTGGALRRIKRLVRALQAGVPAHPRDLPPNVVTAADWIRQCRRAGLYEYGRALYELGGFDFASLGEAGQVAVEEEYGVCVRRMAE
ncbi:MAG TPA: hypothetical protein PKZ84_11620 [Anaerolineae bacterium]|nr:hypothetical protein [Anaerolineae bacterium]